MSVAKAGFGPVAGEGLYLAAPADHLMEIAYPIG